MGGMVCLCSSCMSMSLSCIYSARSSACAHKYMVKVLLAHLPLIFNASNGRPHSKYSRVAPMQMLWP